MMHCSKLFEDLMPEPKTVVHTEGGHISTNASQILASVVNTSLGWLVEKGAINALEAAPGTGSPGQVAPLTRAKQVCDA